jgi:hypothetical protein
MKQSEWRDAKQRIYEALHSGFLSGIAPTEALAALHEANELVARLRQQADDIDQEAEVLEGYVLAWMAENLVDSQELPPDEPDHAPLNDPRQYDAPLFDADDDQDR